MGADTVTHREPSLAMLSRRANAKSVVDGAMPKARMGTLKVKDIISGARDEVNEMETPKAGTRRASVMKLSMKKA